VFTSNTRDSLNPAGFPSELAWTARAVYRPVASAGEAALDVQGPPVPVPLADAVGVAPEEIPLISTVTPVVSVAVPLNVGVVLLESVAGWFSLTWGDSVLIVKATELLVPPGFPSELDSVANAV
jgi:hypothetical protein